MPLQRAKPLDALYEEVTGYDLVVVPDAPLASALNRRLDHPHLGNFAITPRRLAAGRREESEDRLAFLDVVQHTTLDWKRVAHAVGNILQCWEHRGSHDAILEYDAYVDDVTERVVDAIGDLDTASTSARLTDYQISTDRDVAVVGEPRLTTLERSILPDEYDAYSAFTDEAFDYPPFHVFASATAIVDTVVDAVTEGNAGDVGIVLDRESEYSALVEAGLEAAGLPFYGGPGFADHPDHRAFVQFLRLAHAGTDTPVREIRPVLTRLNAPIDVEHDEKRIDDLADLTGVDVPALEWVTGFRERSHDHTFAEALDAFETHADCRLDDFRDELETLGLDDAAVTETAVDRLAFYLQSYDVPVDRENEGVLLADANAGAYVDRPVVFYLGLDDGWTATPPRRPWVDEDAQFTRNVRQFQFLVQSGASQYYLVQDSKGGSPVTPCLYFEELLDAEFERFTDLDATTHAPRFDSSGTGFERVPRDVEPKAVSTVSQSRLSTYVNCPRDHFFDRLVDGPDRDYFADGNLFHDFAEFYVAHPDRVDDGVLDEVVELMLAETRAFRRSVDRKPARTRYRVGVETLVEFLDDHAPDDESFLTPATGWGTNTFAEHFGLSVDSPFTERWFEDESLGVKGKIDLVAGPRRLVDHKSGSLKSAAQVVRNAAIDEPSDTPDFQALLYLLYWRSVQPGEKLEFTFFHFLETLDDTVTGDVAAGDVATGDVATGDTATNDTTTNDTATNDTTTNDTATNDTTTNDTATNDTATNDTTGGDVSLENALTTVTYYPRTFEEHARSRATFDALVEDGAGNCRKTFEQVAYTEYAAVFEDASLPDTRDSDELIDSAFGERLVARMQADVGEYKYVASGCRQALRQLARVRGRNFFREDLDAFEEFLAERVDELNDRRAGEKRFPVEGLGGEPNYRRVNHRDLLMADR